MSTFHTAVKQLETATRKYWHDAKTPKAAADAALLMRDARRTLLNIYAEGLAEQAALHSENEMLIAEICALRATLACHFTGEED